MEKRYHSIVKIVFVAATHNCMYINRGGHVDHPTKTNDQTNKSKFFRGFIVQILIIFTVSIITKGFLLIWKKYLTRYSHNVVKLDFLSSQLKNSKPWFFPALTILFKPNSSFWIKIPIKLFPYKKAQASLPSLKYSVI